MAHIKHRYTDFKKQYLEAAAFKLKHREHFNLKYLYVLMHEWFVEEGYASRNDLEFDESFYLNRETQTAGKEIWVYWRMNKTPVNTKFWRYDMDMDMHVVGLKDSELMHDGKKYKANFGEAEVKIWAKLVIDYKHEWKKHPFLGPLLKIFWKRTVKNTMEMHKKTLYREAYRFQEAVKTYFKISTYLPERELGGFYDTKNPGEYTKTL
jgi:hypothetical protein